MGKHTGKGEEKEGEDWGEKMATEMGGGGGVDLRECKKGKMSFGKESRKKRNEGKEWLFTLPSGHLNISQKKKEKGGEGTKNVKWVPINAIENKGGGIPGNLGIILRKQQGKKKGRCGGSTCNRNATCIAKVLGGGGG